MNKLLQIVKEKLRIHGAVLIAKSGVPVTGDLGIKKDIDIVSSMFSAVTMFLEEAFGDEVDHIRLGDVYVLRFTGECTSLLLTATGISEELVNESQNLLSEIEAEYPRLDDYSGVKIKGIDEYFQKRVEEIKGKCGSAGDYYRDEFGFEFLNRDDLEFYLGELEDAFQLYFISGEIDSAVRLAQDAAAALMAKDKFNKHAALFYAMGARALILERKSDEEQIRHWLSRAAEMDRPLLDDLARGEIEHTKAVSNIHKGDFDTALEHIEQAEYLLQLTDLSSIRNYLRLMSARMTEALIMSNLEDYDNAINYYKSIYEDLDRTPTEPGPVETSMIKRHKLMVQNNIAYAIILRDSRDPGTYKDAIPYYLRALQIVEDLDAYWYSPGVKKNLAMAYCYTGDLDKAGELIDQAVAEAEEMENEHQRSKVYNGYGVYKHRKGLAGNDLDQLYEAMYWFNRALKLESLDVDREYINDYKGYCDEDIRRIIKNGWIPID